jgi:hypothetical protein
VRRGERVEPGSNCPFPAAQSWPWTPTSFALLGMWHVMIGWLEKGRGGGGGGEEGATGAGVRPLRGVEKLVHCDGVHGSAPEGGL